MSMVSVIAGATVRHSCPAQERRCHLAGVTDGGDQADVELATARRTLSSLVSGRPGRGSSPLLACLGEAYLDVRLGLFEIPTKRSMRTTSPAAAGSGSHQSTRAKLRSDPGSRMLPRSSSGLTA